MEQLQEGLQEVILLCLCMEQLGEQLVMSLLLGWVCPHWGDVPSSLGDLALLPQDDFCSLLWHRAVKCGYGCYICRTPYCGLGSWLGSGYNHTRDIWDRPGGHSDKCRMLRGLLYSGKWALHDPFPWPSSTSHSETPGVGTVRRGLGMLAGTGPVGISSHGPHGIILHAAGPWFWLSPWCCQGICIDWPGQWCMCWEHGCLCWAFGTHLRGAHHRSTRNSLRTLW